MKIKGFYGEKTRKLQRNLSRQLFSLTFKQANVYKYLGSATNPDPSIDDISSKVFYEVPDREYAENPVLIDIGMEPAIEGRMDFSRFGIISPASNEVTIRIHMDEFEGCLGRPIIVGDVIEIPFFKRDCERAFWEVTDVDDKPSYEKFYYNVSINPLGDTRKTYDIDVDRSNFDFNIAVQEEQDTEAEASVPYAGLIPPGNTLDVDFTQQTFYYTEDQEVIDARKEEQEVDPRRKTQRGFLDDPNAEF